MYQLVEKTELEERIEQEKKREKRKFWKGVLCGSLAVSCVVIVINIAVAVSTKGVHIFSLSEKTRVENKLQKIQAVLDKYYLYEDDIDVKVLEDGIYSGYTDALGDIYTVYYDEKQTKELKESLHGTFCGIGAAVFKNEDTEQMEISKIYKDSPAEVAGLKEGDVIYQVDDRKISDESLNTVVSWIRGDEGTEVTLHVVRDGEQREMTAVRQELQVETVNKEMREGQIGYIGISEFDDVTLSQFDEALNNLEEQGMQGLVIDLRGNPGGNLDTVTDMLKLMLPKGTIVSIKDKVGKEVSYTSDGKHEFTKPLVVLVDQYSASASEIFAGAIQDYGIGEIVGMTTYGKGVVQQVLDFGDGTAMKVTIAEYFTPNGRSINKKGVKPDVEVKYEPDEEDRMADNQLEKALEVVGEKITEKE